MRLFAFYFPFDTADLWCALAVHLAFGVSWFVGICSMRDCIFGQRNRQNALNAFHDQGLTLLYQTQ